MIGIIENVINIIGDILILVLEILLVVVIGNAGIHAVSNFDGNDFIRKVKKIDSKIKKVKYEYKSDSERFQMD